MHGICEPKYLSRCHPLSTELFERIILFPCIIHSETRLKRWLRRNKLNTFTIEAPSSWTRPQPFKVSKLTPKQPNIYRNATVIYHFMQQNSTLKSQPKQPRHLISVIVHVVAAVVYSRLVIVRVLVPVVAVHAVDDVLGAFQETLSDVDQVGADVAHVRLVLVRQPVFHRCGLLRRGRFLCRVRLFMGRRKRLLWRGGKDHYTDGQVRVVVNTFCTL